MRKWNKGFPPHTGWWYTKTAGNQLWRWFDAEKQTWSVSADHTDSAETAAQWAAQKSAIQPALIEWSNYWPKNARVPRVDTRKEI